MADFGRTSTRVNKGGPQSSSMHKGLGLNKWSGGRNPAGSMPRGNAYGWNWRQGNAEKPGGGAGAPTTAGTAAAPQTAATATGATQHDGSPALTGPPGFLHVQPDAGQHVGGKTASGGGSSSSTANAVPLDIQALVQQLLATANAKVAEAQSFAQAEQQRVQQMLQTTMGQQFSSAAPINSAIQNTLGQVQQYLGGFNWR